MELKDSQTQKNLMSAFLHESGAFIEYSFYAMQAKNEGLEQLYNVFNRIAFNEQAHAKVWFKLWHGIYGTVDNLKNSAELENYERTVLYAEYSSVAKKEGFTDIAELFDKVAKIEGQHEEEFKKLQSELSGNKLFEKKQETEWKCLNCGHVYKGTNPPETCPVCSHPNTYFMEITTN